MTKKSIFTKIMHRFYGLNDPDEYQEREIHKIGHTLFLFLLAYLLLSTMIVLFITMRYPSIELLVIYLGVNTVVACLMIPLLTMVLLKRSSIPGYLEVTKKDLGKSKKQVLRRGVFGGLFWTLGMYLFLALLKWWLNKAPLLETLTSPKHILIVLVVGLGFTATISYMGYKSVKIAKENED